MQISSQAKSSIKSILTSAAGAVGAVVVLALASGFTLPSWMLYACGVLCALGWWLPQNR